MLPFIGEESLNTNKQNKIHYSTWPTILKIVKPYPIFLNSKDLFRNILLLDIYNLFYSNRATQRCDRA